MKKVNSQVIKFDGLAEALIDYNLSPRVICESMSMMPQDALIMKKIYLKTLDKHNKIC